jgi:hydroxyacylglutathione hydrolase
MFNKYYVFAALASGVAGLAGYKYRVEILDALCGTTTPASRAQIEEALDNHAMILDVRMYVETRKEGANIIPEAKNIPLLRLLWNLDDLPRDRTIITYCESGKRAGKVADMLNTRGFKAISGGGILNLQRILSETDQ